MIYLTNSKDIQDVYIPRQDIINVTKQGIDLSQYLTSGETIELIDEKIESATTDFVTSGEVQTQINDSISGIPTQFKTINNESIIGEGNIEIESGGVYSAGTNIDISEENVISVTGITIPDVSQFVTSGEVETLIDAATSDLVTEAEIENFVTSGDVATQIEGYDYITSDDVEDMLVDYATNDDLDDTNNRVEDLDEALGVEVNNLQEQINNAFDELDNYTTTEEVEAIVEDAISGITGGTVYSAGTNIDITNDVISVTGITIPDVSQFVTSGEVKTQIESYNYITSGDIPTSNTAFTNDAGYLTEHQSLSAYSTTDEVETMIENAIPDVSDFVTSGEVATQIEGYHYITSGDIPTSNTAFTNDAGYLTEHQSLSAYSTTDEVETMITGYTGFASTERVEELDEALGVEVNNLQGQIDGTYNNIDELYEKTDTLDEALGVEVNNLQEQINDKQDRLVSGENIKTINYQSILGEGNINIQGGGSGEQFVELTKAQYQALTGYAENTTYIITDADTVDLNDYALESAVTSAVTNINTSLATKATKASVSANTGRIFPRWNTEGIVTGTTGNTVYEQNLNINGTSKTMIQATNSSFGTIYAPTSAGTKNQVLLSNGSGAPVWSGYKFVFCSQTDYDNLATKDATTIYFIVDEN